MQQERPKFSPGLLMNGYKFLQGVGNTVYRKKNRKCGWGSTEKSCRDHLFIPDNILPAQIIKKGWCARKARRKHIAEMSELCDQCT
jgi:hypothetical protein